MPVWIARQVEDVGAIEFPLVVVGRAEYRQDQLAARDRRPCDLHVLACVAFGRQLYRAGLAQELLDRRLGERRVAAEGLCLFVVLEEGERSAGDQVHSGLVASD